MLLFQYGRLNIQMRLQKYISPSDKFVPVAAHLDNKAGKNVLALTVIEKCVPFSKITFSHGDIRKCNQSHP